VTPIRRSGSARRFHRRVWSKGSVVGSRNDDGPVALESVRARCFAPEEFRHFTPYRALPGYEGSSRVMKAICDLRAGGGCPTPPPALILENS